MAGEKETTTVQVYENQIERSGDTPALNRGAQGAGGQPPIALAEVDNMQTSQYLIRSSEKDRSVRYYVITGFKLEDWVVLGEKHRVIEATGVWQDEKLDYITNEGAVVIIETGHGYEYCGVARSGAQSRIYINHMGIDIQNVELRACPSQNEVVPIIQELREHGLSIVSPIMNPWVDMVPYALHVLKNYDTSAYYRVLRGETHTLW